jgi:uncharacterized membrane protein YkoI
MTLRTKISGALLATAVALAGCSNDAGPGQTGGTHYNPPNTEFAAGLGITPPVDAEQAKAIAAAATGGTAVGVDQETENGELLFEVKVETASGRQEVEVRASDGGVVEVEPDDDD